MSIGLSSQALAQRDSASGGVWGTSLGGVVVNADSARVSGADVWLLAVDKRRLTDSTGAFRFDDAPPGFHLLEIRHRAYEMLRDTVTLAPGKPVVRRYVLVRRSQRAMAAGEVSAGATGATTMSPGLAGFEKRRASGRGGFFIADAELRREGSRTLASIVTTRIPALALSRGALVLSGARKDCYVSVFVDGALLFGAQNARRGVAPPDLSTFSVARVGGVEFYPDRSAAPPAMRVDDDGCGSLWVWARD
jgi:hypothetical protein